MLKCVISPELMRFFSDFSFFSLLLKNVCMFLINKRTIRLFGLLLRDGIRVREKKIVNVYLINNWQNT